MRDLTPEEQHLLEERREHFERILEEMAPALGDFAEALGLANPPMIVATPNAFVPAIDQFMRGQVVEADDHAWIVSRLAYFIGEVLNERLRGCWFLNEWPDTAFFLRYVVTGFQERTRPHAMVDPFEAAHAFVNQPPGRQLARWIDELEAGCRG